MTTSTIAQYSNAVAEKVPAEAILGNFVWFTINHADVDLEKARTDLTNLGLSTATLRKRLRPIDAFKKAANTLAKANILNDDGTESNFLVRQVGQDEETSHRHVILERVTVRKGKRRRLSYDKVGEIVYTRGTWDKKTNEVVGDGLDATITTPAGLDLTQAETDWLENGMNAVPEQFEHWKTHLDSHAVRTYVREYIYLLGGTCVRDSGGVYFVFQEHAAELEQLAGWVRTIGSGMAITPILDLVNARETLLKAFEEETIAEVERLSGELSKILQDSDRTITESTFEQYRDKASDLFARTDQYSNKLGTKIERCHVELTMFKAQVLQLAGRVKAPKSRRS